jgi:hypothetical protein
MWGPLRMLDRVLLIACAAVMAVIPLGFSILGIVPAVIGLFIVLKDVFSRRAN